MKYEFLQQKNAEFLRKFLHPILHEDQAVPGRLRIIPGAAAMTITTGTRGLAVGETHRRRQIPDQNDMMMMCDFFGGSI